MSEIHKDLIHFVANEVNKTNSIVAKVIELIDEGNTIPFIARYRKEQTKGLDETEIQSIKETYDYQLQLQTRKDEVIRLIDEQGKLTDELKQNILHATNYKESKIYTAHINKKANTRYYS